ncbi:MAG: glutathione S-transferase family protein [Gammaproteobacteria bacterium]|nr:glutathione S-transferase family protein [Gammaproteobacteria bacterium]MCP4880204.1 glutathione S-transferase family protein [Gammaproteobacteria bacterium]MDP6165078.1 glutathione S-transferase family protein [Gammaproteobacteria bacterium]
MGLLINGHWHDQWYDTEITGGEFKRNEAAFRNWITPDGQPGPTGTGGFAAQAGRYHLFVSLACPWAHRTLIYRQLKGLQGMIGVSIVSPYMLDQGWTFAAQDDPLVGDQVYHYDYAHQLYTKALSDYSGRVTVPILWDKQQHTIVSNESSEIIRMFNSAFDDIGATPLDLYARHLQAEIEYWNKIIYANINNGVYRAGFATTQRAYEKAYDRLFANLDKIEQHLQQKRYLTGNQISEADWRLFTTLVRFDAVYYSHFKCNRNHIMDMPNLWAYLRDLYQQPGIVDTVNMQHIKHHYYASHETINPTRIVPRGPEVDFMVPHQRHLIEDQVDDE